MKETWFSVLLLQAWRLLSRSADWVSAGTSLNLQFYKYWGWICFCFSLVMMQSFLLWSVFRETSCSRSSCSLVGLHRLLVLPMWKSVNNRVIWYKCRPWRNLWFAETLHPADWKVKLKMFKSEWKFEPESKIFFALCVIKRTRLPSGFIWADGVTVQMDSCCSSFLSD